MVVLLLLLGFIVVAAGMFGLGLGVPVKDTTFGAAVLVSSSMAITGGFILVGLAVAVSELRRVLQAGMRQMRLAERFEAERGHGAHRMEPRISAPGAPHGEAYGGATGGALGTAPDAAGVIPTRFDAPEAIERPRKPVREEWPPSDPSIARGPAPPPAFQPASGAGAEPRWAPAASAPERFDAVRPPAYRKPDPGGALEQPAEAPPSGGAGAGDLKSPPLSPTEAAGSAAIRPVRILKSGMINDVGYTLFSDGSIETQTTTGVLRFGSIDEFRRHLDKTG
jgi:hypothetical protein